MHWEFILVAFKSYLKPAIVVVIFLLIMATICLWILYDNGRPKYFRIKKEDFAEGLPAITFPEWEEAHIAYSSYPVVRYLGYFCKLQTYYSISLVYKELDLHVLTGGSGPIVITTRFHDDDLFSSEISLNFESQNLRLTRYYKYEPIKIFLTSIEESQSKLESIPNLPSGCISDIISLVDRLKSKINEINSPVVWGFYPLYGTPRDVNTHFNAEKALNFASELYGTDIKMGKSKEYWIDCLTSSSVSKTNI